MRLRHSAALLFALSAPAFAQGGNPLTIRVRVLDSLRNPVENVSVSVVQALNVTLVSGTTDRNGLRVLRIQTRPDEFEVVGRRVGFSPASKFYTSEQRDTLNVELTLRRLTQRLDAVRVTAEQSIRRQRLTADADAIANYTDRPLIDGTDIITKMRPDMVYGLGGPDACPPVQNVWVNGVRIEDAPANGIVEAKHNAAAQFSNSSVMPNRNTDAPKAPQSAASGPATLIGPHTAFTAMPVSVLSVLASIKPEHIAFVEMHDCKDVSIDKKGGSTALFVSLKDGVTFEPGIGSRVGSTRGSELLKRITLPQRAATATVQQVSPIAPAEPQAPLERFRLRILGLFDANSGAPVDSAEVVDLATGEFARTTETGTVALAFLPAGDNRVILRKAGFKTDTVSVRIAPSDTLPLTFLLLPIAH